MLTLRLVWYHVSGSHLHVKPSEVTWWNPVPLVLQSLDQARLPMDPLCPLVATALRYCLVWRVKKARSATLSESHQRRGRFWHCLTSVLICCSESKSAGISASNSSKNVSSPCNSPAFSRSFRRVPEILDGELIGSYEAVDRFEEDRGHHDLIHATAGLRHAEQSRKLFILISQEANARSL